MPSSEAPARLPNLPSHLTGSRLSSKVALRLLAGGAILGGVGAWLTGHAMQTILFHVRPFDVTALASAAAIMSAVSLGACLLPAVRAARMSPAQALADS